jgi:hypothetical protein
MPHLSPFRLHVSFAVRNAAAVMWPLHGPHSVDWFTTAYKNAKRSKQASYDRRAVSGLRDWTTLGRNKIQRSVHRDFEGVLASLIWTV